MGTVVRFPKESRRIDARLMRQSKQPRSSEAVTILAGTPKQRIWRRWPGLFGSGWFKAAQALVLAVAVFFSLGATDSSSRVQSLDHRLMCVCGCSELLGECNHVGCTESTKELGELRADIGAGLSDQQILDAFVAKYGATVLAAPPAKGFDLVAWIAPFAVFAAALLGTILLIRRWGGLKAGWFGGKVQPADGLDGDFSALDPAERERRERIRRDIEGEN